MKKFFRKIKDWFKRHKPSKRRLIQVYAALLYNANLKGYLSGNIYTGNSKYMCVPGLNCYSCPGAVGSCPLGALQNALAQSGTRAPFYVFGILALLGLFLGRTVCGFLCPAGLGQELLYKIKTPKLKKNKFTRIFSYLKYVILAVLVVALPMAFGLAGKGGVPAFCKYICPAGTFGGALGLLANPSNAGLFNLLGSLFTWKFAVLCVICVASVFIFRFFCRFFCPLGAIYGFFSRIALLGVKLDKNKCTDCGLCIDVCKMDIKRVGDHECIQCGECISVCPAKAIRWKGSKLFVHENAVDTGAPAEVKPLNGLLGVNKATTEEIAATESETVQTVAATIAAEEVREPVLAETTAQETAEAAKLAEAEAFLAKEGIDPVEVMLKRQKRRNFWLEVVAWTAALALLVWSLVYFNFIKKDEASEGLRVGEICPDFRVSVYGGEDGETFTLSDHYGKVTVINFWATWCAPCVAELPYFEQIQREFGDDVTVIAIHEAVSEDVVKYIEQNGWNEYAVTFAQDTMKGASGEVCSMLSSATTLPITVVLDREGKVAYNASTSMTFDTLHAVVQPLVNK